MTDVILRKTPQAPPPTAQERDFLLLNIFVLVQHGYVDRARILANALYLMGDATVEALLARAVTAFLLRDWRGTLVILEELDHADPIERFGSYQPSVPQRMRRYIKARCLHELGLKDSADDALEAYLRHGVSGQEVPE